MPNIQRLDLFSLPHTALVVIIPIFSLSHAEISNTNQTLQHSENIDQFLYTWVGHARPAPSDSHWMLAFFLQDFLVSMTSSAQKFCVTLLTKRHLGEELSSAYVHRNKALTGSMGEKAQEKSESIKIK